MITFKPCVNYRRRDGTYAVRIRVTFARRVRYISTTLTAYPEQLTRSGKIRDGGLLASCDALIRKMREAVADLNPFALEGRDVDWVCRWIKEKMRGDDFRLDFFEYGETVIAEKRTAATAANYRTALNAFARYLGRRELDINDISKPLLQGFLRDSVAPRSGGRKEGANARQLLLLGAIFEAARRTYNDGDVVRIPRSPFEGIAITLPPSQGQRPLDRETMQRIIDARPADKRQAIALAVFVVSFGTMGANIADMYEAQWFAGKVWIYERAKTRTRRADHARMEVEIDDRLKYHLSLLRGPGRWWLPAIRYGNGPKAATSALLRHLNKWQEKQGLPRFTFYAARHTWATTARSIGVEKATVDEGLAHIGDFRIADIYAERDWARINSANRRVLDLFNWA